MKRILLAILTLASFAVAATPTATTTTTATPAAAPWPPVFEPCLPC